MIKNIPQEVYSALKEFGLTDYETRAFIALITSGVSSAKQLSEKTKIPYSRIYDVLVNLENIGWVNVISGRPMKYRAERPAKVAKLAKKQIEEKYSRIETALVEKLEPLFGHEDAVDSTPIWILNGDVENKVKDMITNCEQSLIIFLKNPSEEFFDHYFDEFLDLTEKNVDIKIVINGHKLEVEEKNTWRKISSIAEVQVVNKHIMFDSMLFDKKEMIIFLTSFFKIRVKEENMVFLITEKQLINYAKGYFKMVWSAGEKFSLKEHAK